MNPRPSHRVWRFALIEVLAALLVVAVVVPVVTQVLRSTLRTSEAGTRRLHAAELGSDLLDAWRAEESWDRQSEAGTFDNDAGYHWTLEQKSWEGDSQGRMTELSLRVYYPVQGSEQSVLLATLVVPADSTASTVSTASGGGS